MKKIRIAAMGDLHLGSNSADYTHTFAEISRSADVLVLCGDLTQRGNQEEIKLLIQQLTSCSIPVITVLGNHDYEHGEAQELMKLMKEAKIIVLEGESTVINDVGFAGIKGFCGGFDNYTLAPWGEKAIKDFVQTCIDDSLLLEKALYELPTEKKVVLMHYAPIAATVKGEPLEIYPFLGCSRLVSPIHRFNVVVVFHGHAHHGTFKGQTPQGIPVYNVSVPVLERLKEKKQYVIVEV